MLTSTMKMFLFYTFLRSKVLSHFATHNGCYIEQQTGLSEVNQICFRTWWSIDLDCINFLFSTGLNKICIWVLGLFLSIKLFSIEIFLMIVSLRSPVNLWGNMYIGSLLTGITSCFTSSDRKQNFSKFINLLGECL